VRKRFSGEITVHDTLFMSRSEPSAIWRAYSAAFRGANFPWLSLGAGYRPPAIRHEIGHTILRAGIVNGEHVWVVEGGDGGPPAKAAHAVFLERRPPADLHGHVAAGAVSRARNTFAHAAGANGREDLVRAKFVAHRYRQHGGVQPSLFGKATILGAGDMLNPILEPKWKSWFTGIRHFRQ
jgi:hypothetical protein